MGGLFADRLRARPFADITSCGSGRAAPLRRRPREPGPLGYRIPPAQRPRSRQRLSRFRGGKARSRWRRFVGRRGSLIFRRLVLDRLELESELHGRIVERRERLERHGNAFRHAAERQADLEGLIADGEIPELMLQDDRHFARVLRAHAIGKPHARRHRAERNLEMMIAGQAVLGGIRQNGAHDAAQGGLRQDVVANVISGHGL